MKKINATFAKKDFGQLLIAAQREPIAILKNGKEVAVMLSYDEYLEIEELKKQVERLAKLHGEPFCANES